MIENIQDLILSFLFSGFVLAPRPPNEYNESKEDVASPDAFWPVTQSAHGSGGTASTIYAILHDAFLLDEAPVTGLKSIQFQGTSVSYVDIQHDGLLNGTRALCWLFYIKPDIAKDGVILEYLVDNSGTGFQIWQKSTLLEVKVFDLSGSLVNVYSSDILEIGTWKFVGVNYNIFWGDVDIFVVTGGTLSNSVSTEKFSVTPDSMTLFLNAHGTVRIGAPSIATASEDGFEGKISCLQFYTTSLLGRTQKSTLDLCDPAATSGMPIGKC